MKQTRWLSEISCLSEYARLYPNECTVFSIKSLFLGSGPVVVDSLFIVATNVCGSPIFGPCFVTVLSVLSSFTITVMGKRDLVTLLKLPS